MSSYETSSVTGMPNTLEGVSQSSPENIKHAICSRECHIINNTLMPFRQENSEKVQTGQNITALSILEIVIS